jgi:hypothetical protein
MKRMISVGSIAAAAGALMLIVSASLARADEWNELTYLTFSAPVELPGVALPAGTYMFRHLEDNQRLVQVLSQDGQTVYGTFFTIPESRATTADQPLVTFEERPVGAPDAVKAWFYPGHMIGDEFIYSGDQMTGLTEGSH